VRQNADETSVRANIGFRPMSRTHVTSAFHGMRQEIFRSISSSKLSTPVLFLSPVVLRRSADSLLWFADVSL
ncbi:hypothetical protein HAX54_023218, partial [Datura stramonium]|nr:hypothetical protein [Datura stramonium]